MARVAGIDEACALHVRFEVPSFLRLAVRLVLADVDRDELTVWGIWRLIGGCLANY